MKATKTNIEAIEKVITAQNSRSAWDKGVKVYAGMLLEQMAEHAEYNELNGKEIPEICESIMLNGASDWEAYSWGGSALIYNEDIAETLCTQSELKRNKRGERRPNSRAEWLDVQAWALRQAARMILRAAK